MQHLGDVQHLGGAGVAGSAVDALLGTTLRGPTECVRIVTLGDKLRNDAALERSAQGRLSPGYNLLPTTTFCYGWGT